MRRPASLVIFDCDGVLVDSERVAVSVQTTLLAELGWPLTEAEFFDRFGGRSADAMYSDVARELGDTLAPDWRSWFEAAYNQAVGQEMTLVPGVFEALDAINVPTCVASSSRPQQLRTKLEQTGLYERFRGRIFSASDVPNGKPAPDLFLYAARRLGAHPAECVVVEDSQYGVQAARRAGMHAFAFLGGLSRLEMLDGPATTVFTRMIELPGLIHDWASRNGA